MYSRFTYHDNKYGKQNNFLKKTKNIKLRNMSPPGAVPATDLDK